MPPQDRLAIVTHNVDRALAESRLADARTAVARLDAATLTPSEAAGLLRLKGRVAMAEGDNPGGAAMLADAVAQARAAGRMDLLGDGWLADLGAARLAAGSPQDALVSLKEAAGLTLRLRGEGDWATVRAHRLLAEALAATGDRSGAADALEVAARGAEQAVPADPDVREAVAGARVEALRAAGRGAEVPTVAPTGNSPRTRFPTLTSASLASSRGGTAAITRSDSGAVGRSLYECTATSISSFRSAMRNAVVKTPTPISATGAADRSPSVLMITSSAGCPASVKACATWPA